MGPTAFVRQKIEKQTRNVTAHRAGMQSLCRAVHLVELPTSAQPHTRNTRVEKESPMKVTKTPLMMGILTASALACAAMISTSMAVISMLAAGLLFTVDTEMLKEAFEVA